MIYGYSRVSTYKQKDKGTSLDSQRDLLVSNGAEIVFEDAFTGTTTDRPELNKLMEQLQSGDTLLVAKLDRLARSVSQGSKLIDAVRSNSIKTPYYEVEHYDKKFQSCNTSPAKSRLEFRSKQMIKQRKTIDTELLLEWPNKWRHCISHFDKVISNINNTLEERYKRELDRQSKGLSYKYTSLNSFIEAHSDIIYTSSQLKDLLNRFDDGKLLSDAF